MSSRILELENKLGDAEREAVSRENKLLSRIQDLEKKLGNAESELQLHEDDYILNPLHIPFTQLYEDEVSEELVEEAPKIHSEGENSHLNLEKDKARPYLQGLEATTQLGREEANELFGIQEERRDLFEPIRGENVIEREAEKELIGVPQTKELVDKYMNVLVSEVSHLVSQQVANNELIEEVKEGESPEGNQSHILEETKVASVVPAGEASTAYTEEPSTVIAKRHGGRVHEGGVQRNYTTQYKKLVIEYALDNTVEGAIEHFKELEPNKKPLSKASIYRWIDQLKKAQK